MEQMEQTTLRPESTRDHEAGSGNAPGEDRKPRSRKGHRPHAAPRRGRRLVSLLFGVFFGSVLVLSGVGLGTVSAAVIGMSKLAELQKQTGAQESGKSGQQPQAPQEPSATRQPGGAEPLAGGGSSASAASGAGATAAPVPAAGARSTLGVEAVDASEGAGAVLVGVHVPGPGYAAGLVRGDVLTAFGGTRIASAADLASAVAAARPGKAVTLTVLRANGDRQVLSATPGVVT